MEYHTLEDIFASIEKTRGKIVTTVAALSDEHANFQSAPDAWTVANIVEHLAITEKNLTKVVEKLLVNAEAEAIAATRKIEPPVSFREIGQKFGSVKRAAPGFLVPTGKAKLADSLRQLQESRRALHALRPRLEAVDLSNQQYPHPFFGALNTYYWIAFIGLHELHHLKQVGDVLQNYQQSLEPQVN